MSAKILKALSEDPQQLEKEIGCMTGMLQIFDRQNAITGRRFGHRRLSGARSMPTSSCGSPRFDGSGSANFSSSVFGDDSKSSSSSAATVEKQAPAAEPLDTSSRVSSSDTSTESAPKAGSVAPSSGTGSNSRDGPRADGKLEPGRASLGSKDPPRLSFYFKDLPSPAVEPAKDPPRNSIAGLTAKERAKLGPVPSGNKEEPRMSYDSRDQGRPALDIRDVVRMSINRDPAIKAASTDRSAGQRAESRPGVSSRHDSARPSVDGREPARTSVDRRGESGPKIVLPRSSKELPRASFDGREMSRSSVDLRDTLRALSGNYNSSSRDGGRLSVDGRDAPRASLDLKEPPRFSVSRDAPRFSFDGRELPRFSLDSRESMARGQSRARDAPRLSADGRDVPSRHSVDQRDLLLPNLRSDRDLSRTSFDSRSSRGSSDSLGSSSRDKDGSRASGARGDVQGSSSSRMCYADFVKKTPKVAPPEASQPKEVQVAAADSKRRVPNVVARLMGLEELPDTSTPAQQQQQQQQQKPAPVVLAPVRKPSTEAKLLQDLLQYKPLDQPQTKLMVEQKQVSRQSSRPQDNNSKLDASLAGTKNSSFRKAGGDDDSFDSFHLSRGRSYGAAAYTPAKQPLKNFAEPMPKRPEVSQTKYAQLQKQFPEAILTVLKHSEEVKQQQSGSTVLGDLEERLQQLRVKNSLQERKTLRQILEAMQLKGLLHPPRREAAHQSIMDDELLHPSSYGGYYYKRDRHYDEDLSPRPRKAAQDMKAIHDIRAYQEMRAAEDNMIEVSIDEGKAITPPHQYAKQASIVLMKPVARQQQVIKQKAVEPMPAAGSPTSRVGGRAGKVSAVSSRASRGQHGLSSIATPREPISQFNAEETMSFRKRRGAPAKDLPSVQPPTPESRQATSRNARPIVSASPPKSKVMPTKEPATGSSRQGSAAAANGSRSGGASSSSKVAENGRKQRLSASRDASSSQGRRTNEPEPKKMLRRCSSDVGAQTPAAEAAVKASTRSSAKSSDKGRHSGSLSDSEANRRAAAAVNKDAAFSASSRAELGSNRQQTRLEFKTETAQELTPPTTGSKASRRSAPKSQTAVASGTRTPAVRPSLEEAKDHSFDILSLEHLASTLPYPEVSVDKYEQEPSRLKSGGSFADYDSVLLYQDDVKYLGEVMVDGEEQPSPVSVLDTPFQDEDHSPRAVNKSIVSLKDAQLTSKLEALANEYSWEDQLVDDAATSPSAEPCSVTEIPTKLSLYLGKTEDVLVVSSPERDAKQLLEGSEAVKLAYVRDMLTESGLTSESSKVILAWHSPSFPMDPELFDRSEEKRRRCVGDKRASELEVDEVSRIESLRRSEQEVMDRRLLFDSVNDITARKLRPYLVSQPWIKQSPVLLRKPPTGEVLVEEVWAELQELPCPASEDVCDTLYTMLQKDLAHKGDTWLQHTTEVGEVGLELERMIFKELIEEAVTEWSGFSSRSLSNAWMQRPAAACAY